MLHSVLLCDLAGDQSSVESSAKSLRDALLGKGQWEVGQSAQTRRHGKGPGMEGWRQLRTGLNCLA